jgi:hypothetical protein
MGPKTDLRWGAAMEWLKENHSDCLREHRWVGAILIGNSLGNLYAGHWGSVKDRHLKRRMGAQIARNFAKAQPRGNHLVGR